MNAMTCDKMSRDNIQVNCSINLKLTLVVTAQIKDTKDLNPGVLTVAQIDVQKVEHLNGFPLQVSTR